jgi:GDP-4-dehydro-6-deoxy-D-mannose reductase
MHRVLVTGINGFVGKHLARALKDAGHQVMGVGTEPQLHDSIAPLVDSYHVCDLTDVAGVQKLPLNDFDAVISLAGLANVGDSFSKPDLYKKINVEVLTELCDALLSLKSSARVVAISTGALYDPNQPMPLNEDSRTNQGGSPYAESKLLMEKAALGYREKGLDCVVVRPFNHFGPGQLGGFLIPDLYQKIMTAQEAGGVVKVGNLKTKRDYTDVRDVVRAYIALATAKKLNYGLYNVCSGVSRSGEDILELISREMGVQDKIRIEVDESLLRPNDPADIYGSFERLRTETSWHPTIPFETTIRDFVSQ